MSHVSTGILPGSGFISSALIALIARFGGLVVVMLGAWGGGMSPGPDLLGDTGLVLAQTREFGVESFLYPRDLSGSWNFSLSDLFH